jgi:hypothetical protein
LRCVSILTPSPHIYRQGTSASLPLFPSLLAPTGGEQWYYSMLWKEEKKTRQEPDPRGLNRSDQAKTGSKKGKSTDSAAAHATDPGRPLPRGSRPGGSRARLMQQSPAPTGSCHLARLGRLAPARVCAARSSSGEPVHASHVSRQGPPENVRESSWRCTSASARPPRVARWWPMCSCGTTDQAWVLHDVTYFVFSTSSSSGLRCIQIMYPF